MLAIERKNEILSILQKEQRVLVAELSPHMCIGLTHQIKKTYISILHFKERKRHDIHSFFALTGHDRLFFPERTTIIFGTEKADIRTGEIRIAFPLNLLYANRMSPFFRVKKAPSLFLGLFFERSGRISAESFPNSTDLINVSFL